MVVSSDQPVVAIGQITNFQFTQFGVGIAGGYASEQYRGSPANSSTMSYPTVKSSFGGKTTIFTVQAAGADVTATATIVTSDGVSHTKALTIAANRSVTFGPSRRLFARRLPSTDCGGVDPNTSPCFGSLTVVGNNNIAGVALEYRGWQVARDRGAGCLDVRHRGCRRHDSLPDDQERLRRQPPHDWCDRREHRRRRCQRTGEFTVARDVGRRTPSSPRAR